MKLDIYVNNHARERARERFPGFKAARIVDEVRDAFTAGRVAAEPPHEFGANFSRGCLYAWTEARDRLYPLNLDAFSGDRYVVITTIGRKEKTA